MPDAPKVDDRTKADIKAKIVMLVDERIDAMEGRISKDTEDQIAAAIKQALAGGKANGAKVWSAGGGVSARYVLRNLHDPKQVFEKGRLPAGGLRMDLDVGEASMRGQHSALRMRRKSYDVAQDVAGGRVEPVGVWFARYSMGVFRECGATVIDGPGRAKATVPNIGTFVLSEEAAVDESGRTKQGALSSADVVIKNFVAQSEYSHAAVEDVPGLASTVGMALEGAAMSTEDAQIYALIKTGANSDTAGTVQKVKTGAEDALPAAGALIDKLAEVKEKVRVADRGDFPGWVVSKSIERKLSTAGPAGTGTTTNDYAFDPSMGLTMLFGEPVKVSDHLGAGGTADDVTAIYGGHDSAIYIIVNELYMLMSEHAKLGAYTWYIAYRFAPHLANDVALAALVNEA